MNLRVHFSVLCLCLSLTLLGKEKSRETIVRLCNSTDVPVTFSFQYGSPVPFSGANYTENKRVGSYDKDHVNIGDDCIFGYTVSYHDFSVPNSPHNFDVSKGLVLPLCGTKGDEKYRYLHIKVAGSAPRPSVSVGAGDCKP